MNTHLRALLLAAGAALQLRTIRRAQQILAQALLLDGDPDTCCPLVHDTACDSTITYCGVKVCTLTAGHPGMHEHGGWRWTDGMADNLGGAA